MLVPVQNKYFCFYYFLAFTYFAIKIYSFYYILEDLQKVCILSETTEQLFFDRLDLQFS